MGNDSFGADWHPKGLVQIDFQKHTDIAFHPCYNKTRKASGTMIPGA